MIAHKAKPDADCGAGTSGNVIAGKLMFSEDSLPHFKFQDTWQPVGRVAARVIMRLAYEVAL